MKLRLLNGSHSTLAYLGFLAGFETIWQASADPDLARLIERQMAEEIIADRWRRPPGVDLDAYARMLMVRFRNTALPHRTQQIAMDGSQKLPQRLLGTVRDRLAGGGSYAHLTLAVARLDPLLRAASTRPASRSPCPIRWQPTFAAIAQRAGGDPARPRCGIPRSHRGVRRPTSRCTRPSALPSRATSRRSGATACARRWLRTWRTA